VPARPAAFAARLGLLTLLGAALGGCSIVEDWFEEEEVPLPGERVAVMLDDTTIEPDPAVAGLQIALPPAQPRGDWPQTGGGPQHNPQHPALGSGLRVAWSVDLGAGDDDDSKLLAQPVVEGGRVYGMDARDRVSAIEAASGRVLWVADLEPEEEDDGYFGGGLALADGRVFVTTGFVRVFALSAANGQAIWEAPAGAPIRAAPTVADGRVFAVTIDNQTLALDAATGELLWEHTGIQEIAGLVGASPPAVDGNVVVVPYSSGEIFALLAESGRDLWSDGLMSRRRSAQVAGLAHIRGAPVIDGGAVIAVGHSDRAAAIDLRRGLRIWEQEIGGTDMPWVAGNFVYVLTNDAQVAVLTRDRGQVRWVHQLRRYEDEEDLEDPIVWHGPVLAGDRLILVNGLGQATILSPYTGERIAEVALPGGAALAPVVAGGTLYVVTTGGNLVALR
jgi:outer membrane protein assembly factor BamB